MPQAYVSAAVLVVAAAAAMWATALPKAEAQLGCSEVVGGYFLACFYYLRSAGGLALPAECCSGLRSLVAVARATIDRSAACNCLKMLLEGAAEEVLRRASLLPQTCQITDFPFVISPSTGCSP